MEIITNPIIVAVTVMMVLCLIKVNVIFSLVISSMVGGLLSGIELSDVMNFFAEGMVGNAETALSYVLLGAVAVAIERSGLATIASSKLSGLIKGSKIKMVLLLIIMAALSQTFIPIHIAFIPMIIPSLLVLMNEMKLDRRLASCSLAFGMKATWVTFPVGFGLIFHTIIAKNMALHGMPVATMDVWKYTSIIGLGMVIGMIGAYFVYRKPREYSAADGDFIQATEVSQESAQAGGKKFTKQHIGTLIGVIAIVVLQLTFDSMVIGAMAGLLLFMFFGVVKWKDMNDVVDKGVGIMGFMAFVMLTAAGFSNVLTKSGNVDALVNATINVIGTNHLAIAIAMILLGLVLTIGTGSSFGTVPILAALYIPFAQRVGFDVGATVVLIAGAATIGDAGSPASDSTLGPTAGLNVDGQHDHIWDSCIPQILFFVTGSMLFSVIGAMIF